MSDHLRLEPNVRLVVERLAAANLPPFEAGTAEQARELSRKMRAMREPKPLARVADVMVPGPAGDIALRQYSDAETPRAAILYLHGGGWTLGGIDESDALTRELALTSGCDVYSVEYRLAPEAPFPAGIEDGEAALEWLSGTTDLPLIVMGDSAGANIVTVLARRARDRGDERIVLQILAYPVTDFSMATESYVTFADGPLLTTPMMAWFWEQYLPDVAKRGHQDASPLRADLAGMPRTFILTAEYDVLRDEGEAYAAALQAASVPVTYRMYEGQIHGFLGLVGISAGNAAAFRDIASIIKEAV